MGAYSMNLSEGGARALPHTEDVSNVFSNQFGVSGLLEMAAWSHFYQF